MKNKLIVLFASFTFALTGCKNGTKKVEYNEFHEEAVAASKIETPEVKKVVINGKIESEEGNYTAKNLKIEESTDMATLSLSDIAFVMLVGLLSELPVEIPEKEDTQYYIGGGFRVKNSDAEMAWDEYLSCTFVKGKVEKSSVNITAKYTYEK